MLDLLGLAILAIALPTCMVALASTALLYLWSLVTGRPMQWSRPWVALSAAIRLEFAFLVVGGIVIGVAFGKTLYLGFPIVMATLTLGVGVVGFLYFFWKGIPRWMEWRNWARVILPEP